VTIQRLLVANRGEIARRVFATCRRLGIETVAVHADADADLPFVHEADVAVRLPGNAPADTYLRVDLLLDAARRTGADACTRATASCPRTPTSPAPSSTPG
jgi:propionyl-CoA carboxylase alpha chain